MEHRVLPECIDRLARIEENQDNMRDNHLPHIYDELKGLRDSIKRAQAFFITQIVLFGAGVIGILLQFALAK